ncbi:dihydrolipoyl dehydrogenase [Cryptosporangium aurantiacum]|uniref:Dihydrolipoyl dehydrogenase n=1 Tax=Cryptosporangium aurantiacum TaxID=134849 RepID=A0A1M7R873_9ACTN|nr:dihydrolipoyl dehydrogenase [Cryptosporangium aurantiacum]SHN42361.1 dihydrolipoamide dehydrogenase [Cryptosporangium aurantiacum]
MSGGRPTHDIVVLGGGSGGYSCALRAAELGLSVVLVERDKLGGTCLHRGCIPTKALLHAGEVADTTRDAARFGIKAEFYGVDLAAVLAYQDSVVSKMYRGLTGLVNSRGVTVVHGTGRLTSPTTVQVGSETYEGRHVVLATGSVPSTLPGLEIDGRRVLTSDHALRLEEVPGSAVILGGGVIGVEFASAWRSLGADVTIVEALPRLLPTEEESSSHRLERAFRRRGIGFRTGTRFVSAEPSETGVRVVLSDDSALDADVLLVAVGRAPVSADLGYPDAGVAMERGHVLVDELCRTNVPTISAVGDLIPTPQLAHVGFAEGILVAERVAGLPVTPIDYAGVPRVTYSEPEVASVGLTTEQARARGYEIEEVQYDLAGNGKATILRAAGAVTVLRAKDGPVLGVHLVGSRMGELAAEAQLIYNWEAFPEDVAPLLHPHPTQSEALGEAHLALAGKPLHVHT